MEISKTYQPESIEKKWYDQWLLHRCFESQPDEREPFTIVIPPPNVTGVLHMGHMLNNTIQDVLIRRARMMGKNACWVPGTDHASIATEAKVVNLLKEKGLTKEQIGREAFLEHAFSWKEKYGGIILDQLKKLGASCDWSRTRFTMEADLSAAVNQVFVSLYEQGLIYRGARMINWDPVGKTALSDEEVNYKEEQSQLYYIAYQLDDGSQNTITVATTRPETILGDVAICVNPDDSRYQHLIGCQAIVPIVNRRVPIIADQYVDPTFGTGALKITPAHDINDYNIGLKHGLAIIDVLNEDGTLSPAAQHYVGLDRFEVRKTIAKDLADLGNLIKTEQIINKVGHSERTDAIIEPRISTQWFLKMDALANTALEQVQNGTIKFYPDKFFNTFKHWMTNTKDWCISRQLWWGQQIPAWYLPNGDFVVANNVHDAMELFHDKGYAVIEADLTRDADVVDTWFSSWLWPISVFDGFKNPVSKDFEYYYPTQVLVTGHDIIFFWVARMIMAGMAFKQQIPFKDVYFTGMVRDKLRRKMSKSLGNSPDPLVLIDKFGADGVRLGLLLSSPAGGDLLFDESLCEQGRNFANKIWNAYRLVSGWEQDPSLEPTAAEKGAVAWFESRFNQVAAQLESDFEKYRLSEIVVQLYKLIWDDFCAWYLEMVKPAFQQPISSEIYGATIAHFDKLLRLLHPFMPFITEELWQNLHNKSEEAFLCTSNAPQIGAVNAALDAQALWAFNMISQVRNLRAQKQISPKEPLKAAIAANPDVCGVFLGTVAKLANLSEILFVKEIENNFTAFLVQAHSCGVLISTHVDVQAEISRIEKELIYQEGFKSSVLKKLENEKFVNTAPETVVANERKKLADAEFKIKALSDELIKLKNT